MARSLMTTLALTACVAFTGAIPASAAGPHHHHHHHGGGYGYGGYGYGYGGPRYVTPAPIVIRPRPVVVAPQPYVTPAPCMTDYGYNYGYNGYAPSGVGFSNRNFSLWLGR